MTFARPISPREAARIEARLAREGAPSPSFSVRDVLSRSFGVVRERWLTLALLTFGLGFAPQLALRLTVNSGYHMGSHDVRAFAIDCAEELAIVFALHFSRTTVVSVSLKRDISVPAAILSVLAALPALVMVWLAGEYDAFWEFWNTWADPFRSLLRQGGLAFSSLILSAVLLRLVVALVAVAMFGVVTPVILAERKSFAGALIRTWALVGGARGRIVALYALIVAAEFVCGLAEAIWLIAQHGSHGANIRIVGWVVGACEDAIEAFWAIILASVYVELLRLREGAPHDQLAEIFD